MHRFLLAFTTAAMSSIGAFAQELPTRTENKVVVSGQRAQIWSHFSINPDCSSTGPLTVRVQKTPTKGKFEHAPGKGFPNYKDDNPRFKCNQQAVEGTLFHYTSDQDYVGADYVEFEVISSVGTSTRYRFRITVK